MKIWLRTLGAMLMLVTAQAFAQTTTHSVYLDTDANAATGCTVVTAVGDVTGAEVRISAIVGGSPPLVLWVSRASCIDGVFGNAPQVPAGHPVGMNLGIDASDVVEFSTSRAGLGVGGTVPAVFVSSDGTSVDLARGSFVLAAPVPGGGPGEGGAVAVPGLGGFALLLLTGLIIWRVWRHPGMGATLIVIVMVGSMGVAWAANFVMDGKIPDWAGVPGVAASPANGGGAGADIRRAFAASEGGRVYFRTDVRDLGNPGDPPVDPPDNPPGSGNRAPTLAAASFNVPENSANGTAVGTVVGSDPDGQPLTYSITGGNTGGAFAINASTGAITVANSAALDYEVTPNFSVTVSVTDGSLSASRTFSIALQDVVNEGPGNSAPTLAAASFSVPENSANGTAVGTVVGSDPDGQPLTYSITGGNPGGAFAINASTGAITVANSAALDYEANPTISVTVSVSDGSLSASRTFSIALQDVVNEGPPGNSAPTLAAASFSVPENSSNGTAVGTVVGSDPDGQPLTYSIASGNTGGAFAINSSTGAITVANSAAIDYELSPNFNLLVSVSDGSASASATINIALLNVNDAPTLSGGPFSVPENSIVGTAVGAVVGDAHGSGRTLSYSIVSGNTGNAFAVNPATGAITVLTPSAIDYETTPSFNLVVRVSDGGSPAQTGTASITISLVDVVNEGPGGGGDVGAYEVKGSCGILGLLGPGFTLTAGSAPLPVGTVVTITGSGVANIGVFSVTGGTANVNVLSNTARQMTLTSELPAGATIAARTTLSISVAFSLNATATLPAGYTATGGKPSGNVSSTLILCSAN